MYEEIVDEFNKKTLSKSANLVALSKGKCSIENAINQEIVSDVNKLFRLSAWVLRFITNLKQKRQNEKLYLDKFIPSSEINYAKILWLQVSQKSLKTGQNFINLKNALHLEHDKNEWYHAKSRIGNADSLLYDTKYPTTLNRKHRIIELLIQVAHNRINYLHERQALAKIRYCYWISRSKSFIKKILHSCMICRKFNSRPYSSPNSPNLSNIRVNDDVAFFGSDLMM